jgi:isocitrate dehydrogenase
MGDLALVSSDNGIVQGQPVDIDGYYLTNSEKTSQAMRPSQTLNLAIASL